MALPEHPIQNDAFWPCFILMYFATFAFNVALIAVEWVRFDCGSITLWVYCEARNKTINCEDQNDENFKPKCMETTTQGPVWLEVCRTLVCLSLVLFFVMHYFTKQCKGIERPAKTLKDQLKLRTPLMCYFLSGLLSVASAFIFGSNYYDYYSADGLRRNIQRGPGILVGYICGGITTFNSIIVCIHYDTGFNKYVKENLSCCKSPSEGNNSTRQQNTNVEVKCRFINCLKPCIERIKKRESNTDTNTNAVSVAEQDVHVRNKPVGVSIQTQTDNDVDLSMAEMGGASAIVQVSCQDQQMETETGNGQMNILIVNDDGSHSSPRDLRPVPATHVGIGITSSPIDSNNSGNGATAVTQNQSAATSGEQRSIGVVSVWSTPVPVMGVDIQNGFYSTPEYAPPSYEDAIQQSGNSNC